VSALRVELADAAALHELRYLNARPGGGTEVARLPIVRAHVQALGDELDAIIACSDLQGIVTGGDGTAELLGVAVAAQLEDLAFDGALPPAARTGIVLAGDLYSVPAANKRGGRGDVTAVWRAFAERFAWVAGVAGNHDDVSAVDGLADHVHLLDGASTVVDGLRIGGVGGIGRRDEADFLRALDAALVDAPDVLVLHEGPHGDDRQPGNAALRAVVEDHEVALTICGHVHWGVAIADHPGGQILNVDTRVVAVVARSRAGV
jgi:Icc protein